MDANAAARSLLQAHLSGDAAEGFPPEWQPKTIDDAYAIQDLVAAGRGPTGGWKVGQDAQGLITCAPIPATVIKVSGTAFDAGSYREGAIEVELAFIMGRDLPTRALPYQRADVIGAISAFSPLIEIIATRFSDSTQRTAIENLADGIRNGAFILGKPVTDWQSIDLTRGKIDLVVDGSVRQSVNPDPKRDPIRLLTWLANHTAARCGGLKAGQIVTTGSLDGATAFAPGNHAKARYRDLATVEVWIV